jgi:hypothetical protein
VNTTVGIKVDPRILAIVEEESERTGESKARIYGRLLAEGVASERRGAGLPPAWPGEPALVAAGVAGAAGAVGDGGAA